MTTIELIQYLETHHAPFNPRHEMLLWRAAKLLRELTSQPTPAYHSKITSHILERQIHD